MQLKAQQQIITDSISWQAPREISISKYDKERTLYFTGAQFDHEHRKMPFLTRTVRLNQKATVRSLGFSEIELVSLSQAENTIASNTNPVGDTIAYSFATVYDKGVPFLEYRIFPFLKRNGQIQKIKSYELTAILGAPEYRSLKKSTTTESVLNSGNWVRIGVTSTGIHKLSATQLQGLGLSSGIDPRTIKLYGNGGAALPERNNVYYPDDLIENAIYIEGENDGIINDGDFLLFYAEGSISWDYDASNQVFRHNKNLYSDTAWYFVTISPGFGKRIENQAQSTNNVASVVTTFSDYAVIENDEENFIKSGRKWYGNRMESGVNSHSFNLSFPNCTAGPHKLTSVLASRSSSSTNFSITANGQSFIQVINGLNSFDYLDAFARENQTTFDVSGNLSSLNINVSRPSGSGSAWIDYLRVNVTRNLIMSGNQTAFRNPFVVEAGRAVEYQLSNSNSNTFIWEITNPYDIKRQLADLNGSTLVFRANVDSLREFVAFQRDANFATPVAVKPVTNQNLHGLAQVDLVIVVPPFLSSYANQLADLHRTYDNMSVAVVSPQQIYNEFSSGSQDISAIRNFMRMFYERAQSPAELPKHLLLFGDGSYDYKYRLNNNTNLIPTYQSVESINPIGSFCSDDFFGFLDPTEGANIQSVGAGLMDIGVGRFPISTAAEADGIVKKIAHYMTSEDCMKDWRNLITFVTDDEDSNTHLNQAENVSEIIHENYPVYNIDKIYLDAFQQQTGAGGQRYPEVNTAINNRIERGTLMINYAGHGGEESLALERVITIDEIQNWESIDNLTLFMTATCEFSRFDNPDFTSAGEYAINSPIGGAIGLFTTLRLTFSSSNEALNRNVMNVIFTEEGEDNENLRLGEILRRGKNATGSSFNNRSFALLGDPALRLAFPRWDVYTTKINGNPVGTVNDTIGALDLVTIEGIVTDHDNNILENFNGVVTPTVFDKPATYYTLGNDPGSFVAPFQMQRNVIFRGPATVTNGKFSFSFVVPQDIQFSYGLGKISYYAKKNNSLEDAHGYTDEVIIGGFSDNPTTDDEGPSIKLYMNNTQFVDGGITDENPVFLAYCEDDIGINTVGTGIGHDITAILDGNTSNPIVLNDFFEAELDNFRKGVVTYPFRNLAEGEHTIVFKVWDVANNSATASIRFVVKKAEDISLAHVLNYPNPFTTHTEFYFEHNQPGVPVDVDIQIFTISGKVVTTLQATQMSNGYRSEPIVWNGLDEFGDRLGRGVYVYKLKVRTPDGKTAEKIEKLVIL